MWLLVATYGNTASEASDESTLSHEFMKSGHTTGRSVLQGARMDLLLLHPCTVTRTKSTRTMRLSRAATVQLVHCANYGCSQTQFPSAHRNLDEQKELYEQHARLSTRSETGISHLWTENRLSLVALYNYCRDIQSCFGCVTS